MKNSVFEEITFEEVSSKLHSEVNASGFCGGGCTGK